MNEQTERPDKPAAQRALDKTPSDMMRTMDAVAESRRLIGSVREIRRANHVADKLRAIIVGHV